MSLVTVILFGGGYVRILVLYREYPLLYWLRPFTGVGFEFGLVCNFGRDALLPDYDIFSY